MHKILFYTTALLLLTAACNKDDSTTKGLGQRETTLSGKKWRIKASSTRFVAGGQTFMTDAFANLRPCERDNFLVFNADKTLVRDEGPTKCAPADPQTLDGKWVMQFDGTNTVLSFNDGIGIINAEVVLLTESALNIRYTTGGSVAINYESEYVSF